MYVFAYVYARVSVHLATSPPLLRLACICRPPHQARDSLCMGTTVGLIDSVNEAAYKVVVQVRKRASFAVVT